MIDILSLTEPHEFDICAQYKPGVVAVICEAVIPVDQSVDAFPVDSTLEKPPQYAVSSPIEKERGGDVYVTLIESRLEQLPLLVTWTQYVPAAGTVRVCPVEPSFHR